MSGEESFIDLQQRLRDGDGTAGSEIFRRYRERLIHLAAPRLAGKLRTKVDPEDVVQSAFRSFFRAEETREFGLGGWNDLWSVLVTITLRKCRYQVRHFLTIKRDIRREQAQRTIDSPLDWQTIASDPTPVEAAEFADLLITFLGGLDERARQIVELSLEGYSPAEIAPKVSLTERTVYRQLDRIRARLEGLDPNEGNI